MSTFEKILVPVDFSESSKAALEHAAFLATELGSSIEVMHVVEPPDFVPLDTALAGVGTGAMPQTLGEIARQQAEKDVAELIDGVDRTKLKAIDASVRTGYAHEIIVDEAEKHDLVVMGTHGRTGLAHLVMGSVAERVVRRCKSPVLTVKAPLGS